MPKSPLTQEQKEFLRENHTRMTGTITRKKTLRLCASAATLSMTGNSTQKARSTGKTGRNINLHCFNHEKN